MTHLTELAEHLASRRLGEGDWDNVSLVAEWIDTSLNRCGLSLTTSPDTREVLEWQPIESAPHDWSWFLGWGPDVDHAILRLPANPIWAELPDCTHWMPLPEPPRTILVRSKLPIDREEWSLCFHGSPPAVFVKAGIPGLPDSRRDIAYMEFVTKEERVTTGKLLQKLVSEHNAAITAIGSQSIELRTVERKPFVIEGDEPLAKDEERHA